MTKTEMRCLLARRKRMQELSAYLETQIYATFLEDINQRHLHCLAVDDKHFESAGHLISMLPSHSLWTLDALHLAMACNVSPLLTACLRKRRKRWGSGR